MRGGEVSPLRLDRLRSPRHTILYARIDSIIVLLAALILLTFVEPQIFTDRYPYI